MECMQCLAPNSIGVLGAEERFDKPLPLHLGKPIHASLAVRILAIEVVLTFMLVLSRVFNLHSIFTHILFFLESRHITFGLIYWPWALRMHQGKFWRELVRVGAWTIAWQAALEFVLSVRS